MIDGKPSYYVTDHTRNREVKATVNSRLRLHMKDGTAQQISIKPIIRAGYNDEYCIDNIPDLDDGEHGREVWKYVGEKFVGSLQNAHQTFLVSNYGRFKSYTDCLAKIMNPYENDYGYLRVFFTRNHDTIMIRANRLVAYNFNQDELPEGVDFDHCVVHHKKGKTDNESWNLQIFTPDEHRRIH